MPQELRFSTHLAEVADVPPALERRLQAAGLQTVQDVLLRTPRRYEDRRNCPKIGELAEGEAATLQLHVYAAGWKFSHTRYFQASAGAAEHPEGPRILLRWFNMPYVAKLLATGMNISAYGKVRYYAGIPTMANPEFEVTDDEEAGQQLAEAALGNPVSQASSGPIETVHTARIVPIYRAVGGIPPRRYRELVWQLLSALPPDARPEGEYDIAPSYPWVRALRDLHFPESEEAARKARLRFSLRECFARQFCVAWRRRQARAEGGQVTATTDAYLHELLDSLPFSLTAAQQRSVQEIRADMAVPRPMNRLLQGDVGSGKTLVALCAMLLALESGKTAALMAPTQILAEQHYKNFRRLLAHTDVRLSLRTSDRAESDTEALPESCDTEPHLVVGTHALLYKKNRPVNLGLVVIDEQHKFGVTQRARLIDAGERPDVLVMTATPIPRTLTLTLYGDLDVSVLDELPAGRGRVLTVLRTPKALPKIVPFLQKELEAGRQVYIVAPLVEESEATDRASAIGALEAWQRRLPGVPMGLLHGRLSAEEKECVMQDFHANRSSVLVATTVVEVGVDVPNASVMIIHDADSFGLSQLHQLRGRIGRGQHAKSYCILLSDSKPGETGREKLDILCRTQNGFEIAEEDFRLRGPGDVLGTAQSGLGAVQFPDWISDMRLIHRANRDAERILNADPHLLRPEHAPLLALVQQQSGEGAVVS